MKGRLQNSVLQFTEIKIYYYDCKAQQRLKEISVVYFITIATRTATEVTKTGYSTKNHLRIDQSIFAPYGTHATNYFASLGIFMRQGRRTQR